jgi:hypothetical protein
MQGALEESGWPFAAGPDLVAAAVSAALGWVGSVDAAGSTVGAAGMPHTSQ